jgi:hypothetical protein
VLNRKNALFAGHDEGAANWACIASLIECCKLNDVDPQAYLADVLAQARQPLARLPHRRPHALGLGRRASDRQARQGRCLTIDPIAVESNLPAL